MVGTWIPRRVAPRSGSRRPRRSTGFSASSIMSSRSWRTLYRAGEGLYKTGSLDAAAPSGSSSRRSALNPNHVRASELLADILIARREWTQAQDVLERLHAHNPGAARARLVQVLLALVDTAEGEDDRLARLGSGAQGAEAPCGRGSSAPDLDRARESVERRREGSRRRSKLTTRPKPSSWRRRRAMNYCGWRGKDMNPTRGCSGRAGRSRCRLRHSRRAGEAVSHPQGLAGGTIPARACGVPRPCLPSSNRRHRAP